MGKQNASVDLSTLEAIERTREDSDQIAIKLKDLNSRLPNL